MWTVFLDLASHRNIPEKAIPCPSLQDTPAVAPSSAEFDFATESPASTHSAWTGFLHPYRGTKL